MKTTLVTLPHILDLTPGMVLAVTDRGLALVAPVDTRAADMAAAEHDMSAALAARSAARGYDAIVTAERAFGAAARRYHAAGG